MLHGVWKVLAHLWPATIRWQLICGVALIHLLLMTLFISDLVERQRSFLTQQSLDQTQNMARVLATNSTSWVLANDVVGLGEQIHSIRSYPGLRYAMIISSEDRILAHTEASRIGMYLSDSVSLSLASGKTAPRVLYSGPQLLDVAVPVVTASNRHVGWARIGQGQEQISDSLWNVSRNGIFYTLMAVIAGSAMAILIGTRLTSRLKKLLDISQQIKEGRRDIEMSVGGSDEMTRLSEGLNQMLNAISASETAQRKASDLLDKVINTSNDYIFVRDMRLRVILCNQVFAQALGKTPPELYGKTVIECGWNPKHVQGDLHTGTHGWEADDCAVLRGETIRRQDEAVNIDGGTHYLDTVKWPLRDTDGQIIGLLGVSRDVTERKLAEEALKQYREHLEVLVRERTAELERTKTKAEMANRAKSIFLANMSHELRTPMNAILGFTSLMKRDPAFPAIHRENLDIISRSGMHLLSLISDVLDMAKVEAGRVEVEIAPFDLSNLILEVTDLMRIRAEENGVQLIVDPLSRFPRYVKGDEGKLRQVLINLLGNAVKFTQKGGITLRLHELPDAAHALRIEVEDTGIGIAPEDQPFVFEPFAQFGEVGIRKGSGLGLPITRQYVELMQGHISFESTLGRGSVFRVEVPLAIVEDNEIVKTKATRPEVVSLQPGQPKYRILVVEDQLDNQLLLKKMLAAAGFQVETANNGQQAIEIFTRWKPHLIWMDHRMPVMSGIEATRRIRKLEGGASVKIIAVTASAFKEQRDEMLKEGMDDFVLKPYQSNEIFDCMAKHLGVRYIYEEHAVSSVFQPCSAIHLDSLAALPQELRSDLKNALVCLDVAQTNALIRQISAKDARLGGSLECFARSFDYMTILRALERIDEHDGQA